MIRKATISDASRIAEIDVAGERFAYKNIVSATALYKGLLVENRIAVCKKWITEDSFSVYVYEDDSDGIVKGMMGTGKCCDDDKQNAFELFFLYVEPYFSRNGIGTEMIKFFENEGTLKGYKEFVIWVLEKNEIGKNCYEKNGFHFDGKEKIFQRFNLKENRYIKAIC
ncbi:MAG: GNAT family N-acetyltransferase [Treponemataceae bacterium]|nr:GNAT family N-acetyltransferase [Treponemataceae bacterium]